MNFQTLAPPITKENAAEYARRATIAREKNRARRKAEFLAWPDVCARKEIEKQIRKVLRWMDGAEDKKEYARLCVVLDRLWKKAYGEVRPTKRPTGRPPLPAPIHDWKPASEPPQSHDEPPAPEPAQAPETVEQIRSPSTQDLTPAPAAPPAPAPPVPVEPVRAQTTTAPLVFASEPAQMNPQRSGPKICQPHELVGMLCRIGGATKN